jgi:hypothetical protein
MLDASDAVEAFARVEVTLIATEIPVEDVGVDLRDQGVVLTGGQAGEASILRSGHLVQTGCSFEEAVNQSLGVVLLVGTDVDAEATGFAGHRGSKTRGTGQGTTDTTVIELSQGLADLTGNRATHIVVRDHLVQRVHEGTGDQEVIQFDRGFGGRGITGAQDGGTRGVVRSGDAASVDELVGATVGDLLIKDSLLEDRGVAEGFVHFAAE